MNTYIFYSSDIAVNVYDKKSLTPGQVQQLKAEGFRKLPFATEAQDEAQATDMMLAHFKENTAALAEYAKDWSFSAAIFVMIYALI
ncbi:hypothetical protein [Enterobacter sp. Bisph1]|uniref:hypothetical protein n=1 Tax=Enterobacter sp. Bisph1 TaxID=1274399 RepID=UPI00057BD955|nr:hypothetical protein [Enterobacter sp. Bisph1]